MILADRKYGWNRHVWDTPADSLRHGLQLELAGMFLFMLSTWFTKLSLLCFYRRLINSAIHRVFSGVFLFMVLFVTLGSVDFGVQLLTICR